MIFLIYSLPSTCDRAFSAKNLSPEGIWDSKASPWTEEIPMEDCEPAGASNDAAERKKLRPGSNLVGQGTSKQGFD